MPTYISLHEGAQGPFRALNIPACHSSQIAEISANKVEYVRQLSKDKTCENIREKKEKTLSMFEEKVIVLALEWGSWEDLNP